MKKRMIKPYMLNGTVNAFSLMEMMVVLLIVAIVAAATAPMITKKLARNAGSMSNAIEFFGLNSNFGNSSDRGSFIVGGNNPHGNKVYINSNANQPQLGFGKREGVVGDTPMGFLHFNTDNGIVLGGNGSTAGDTAVAFGRNTNAGGVNATAIGANTNAGAANTVALGVASNATQTGAVAIRGTASGQNAVAIGQDSTAAGVNSVTISGNANHQGTTAIGSGADATNDWATALGVSCDAEGQGSTAVGSGANATGEASIAIGNGNSNVAASRPRATKADAIAIGRAAEANGTNAITLGHSASATGENSVAIGHDASATAKNAVAIGNGVNNGRSNVIQLGTNASTVYIPGDLIVGRNVVLNYENTGYQFWVRERKAALDRDDNMHYRTGWGTFTHVGVDFETEDDPWWGDYNHGQAFAADRIEAGATGGTHTFQNGFSIYSDRRIKNIGDKFTGGLAELKKLDLYNFTFKKDKENTPQVGVMAQDLRKIFPTAVWEGSDGYLRIRWDEMFYAVINAVRELDKKIETAFEQIKSNTDKVTKLQNKVDEQQKVIADLEKRLAKLEAKK